MSTGRDDPDAEAEGDVETGSPSVEVVSEEFCRVTDTGVMHAGMHPSSSTGATDIESGCKGGLLTAEPSCARIACSL